MYLAASTQAVRRLRDGAVKGAIWEMQVGKVRGALWGEEGLGRGGGTACPAAIVGHILIWGAVSAASSCFPPHFL